MDRRTSLEGKTAIITGATSGIGRATAVLMARMGANVVAAGRRVAEGEETARLASANGGVCRFVQCDVTDADQVKALINAAVTEFGRLDCAFNNAGVFLDTGKLHEADDAVLARSLDVNVLGTWNCMKAELAVMAEQGAGVIVNDSSLSGLQGTRRHPAYTAAKHAVIGLMRGSVADYVRSGVRINTVCPGPIDTTMMDEVDSQDASRRARREQVLPMGRYGTANEVAELVVWLCSDAASHVNGQAIAVDGGLSLN